MGKIETGCGNEPTVAPWASRVCTRTHGLGPSMVIVQLVGGLGNQMFQYAVARAVAYRTNVPLKLDATAFVKDEVRSYRLGCFNIVEDFATETDMRCLRRPRRRQVVDFVAYQVRTHLSPWYRRKIIEERAFSFDSRVLKIAGDVYLAGYWQSEKYFADVAELIRQEFTLKSGPDEVNRQVLDEIEVTNSVSLHIRRGDYVSDPDTHRIHGVIGLDYYSRAIDYVAARTTHPHFFVFSDDIAWAKENLRLSFPLSFIDHNGEDSEYEDLRLMCHCKHHIIANSSFSWWGAWLDANPDKNVVSPEKWFNDPSLDTRHLIPESWTKIRV
jgi:hypothetical protein